MKKRIKSFIVITFAFSWLVWLPGVLAGLGLTESVLPDEFLLVIGALAPFLATFYLERKAKGMAGIKKILKRSFDPRIGLKWLIVCIGLPLLILWITRFAFGQLESNLPISEIGNDPLALFPFLVILFLIGGGLNEEIGWRNYVLEYYQTRHNALKSSIILAGFWIVWHLPLFFMSNTNQATIPFWLFIFPVIPLTVLITWIYNNTNGSIFAVAMFHAMGNMAHEIFMVTPTTESPSITGMIILAVVYSVVAIIVIAVFGYKTLKR